MPRLRVLLFLVLAVAACEPRAPASWVQGGSRLDIPRARWTRGGHLIDIMADGQVLSDGEHLFSLDVAGRLFQIDNDPIAVLQADGRLLGQNDIPLGRIGVHNAAAPGRDVAWLTVSEQGEVLHLDPDGESHPDGGWEGCGAAVRACTLVTHVLTLGEAGQYGSHPGFYGPSVGVGVGVGVGAGVGVGVGTHVVP